MQIKQNCDMTASLQKSAFAMLSIGRDELSNALKSPSSAGKLFHSGSKLREDWDYFHLRETASPAVQTQLDPKRKKREGQSESETSESPKKLKRIAAEKERITAEAKAEEIKVIRREYEEEKRMMLAQAATEKRASETRIKSLELEIQAFTASAKDLREQHAVSQTWY